MGSEGNNELHKEDKGSVTVGKAPENPTDLGRNPEGVLLNGMCMHVRGEKHEE